MQCRRWQGDAYRLADRQPTHIVHQVLARPDAHRIAVKTARIRALHDLAAQYDTALDRLTGLAKPHILAAEMGIEERVAGPASDSLGGQQCGIDFDAVADLLSIATHPQRHDIAGAHEGRDEGRIGAIVDLFRGSDLGGSSGIEDDDAVGHHHGLLPVVGDMHGGDAERLLQRFDLVAHLLTNPRVEIGQRFVEQQYLRIDGKSAAERNALPLTAGECRYLALVEPLQPQHREQLGHSPGDLGAAGLSTEGALRQTLASSGRPMRELYDGGAAAFNLLHFDTEYERSTSNAIADNVGWLDFTHALTFANAGRHICDERPDLWPRAALQLALFVGRNRKYVRLDGDGARWRVDDRRTFLSAATKALYDHGIPEPIIACHRLKVLVAIQDELGSAPDAPWAKTTCAAVNRYLHTPMKRHHGLRIAAQALDFVGKEE
jgi:hypothetical protein